MWRSLSESCLRRFLKVDIFLDGFDLDVYFEQEFKEITDYGLDSCPDMIISCSFLYSSCKLATSESPLSPHFLNG